MGVPKSARVRTIRGGLGPGGSGLATATFAEGPRAAPRGRIRSGERRRGARGGAAARRPPIGGLFVGEFGDRPFDPFGELARVLALVGPKRRAEGHVRIRESEPLAVLRQDPAGA